MSESRKQEEMEERESREATAEKEKRETAEGDEERPGEESRSGEEAPEEEVEYEELDESELIDLLAERDRRIGELEQQVSEMKEVHLRKAAELENYRKRVQRERAQIYETAKANALEDFLSVNDDLRRTLEAADDLEVNDTFMEGVTLVAEKFEEVLRKHGVERIDEEMVPFDVDLHDAMMRRKPEDEDIESDMVLKVVENGYRLGDRTIRHAKVIVSE